MQANYLASFLFKKKKRKKNEKNEFLKVWRYVRERAFW